MEYIEAKRSNPATTRNCRLAIINKRATQRAVAYLEPEEARAVIAAVDTTSALGCRDRALLLILYNTGARVSEFLPLRPNELRLERPRQVRLLGKGKRERICRALA
ncbi:MAG: tyrosine-type recombinase/integrase [Acidobacteriota bacterium]